MTKLLIKNLIFMIYYYFNMFGSICSIVSVLIGIISLIKNANRKRIEKSFSFHCEYKITKNKVG